MADLNALAALFARHHDDAVSAAAKQLGQLHLHIAQEQTNALAAIARSLPSTTELLAQTARALTDTTAERLPQ